MKLINDPILPMSELRIATNNFSEENLLKQTPSVVLYKGQLVQSGQSIPIVVRRHTNLNVSFNEGWASIIHIHKNIATAIKVASEELADDDVDFDELGEDTIMKVMSKEYMIYKYEVNESLDKHLSGSTLTWMQRLNICLEMARVLCYIHHDCYDDDRSIIHGNIKSSKIWLNHNWEPTLHGLRGDMMLKKHGVYHPSNYDGTLQYTDPDYEKTKALSHKSDVYSFGVVLFEVLLGREASIPISDENNWSFARFARSHYERETLSDIIDPVLRQQMDSQSLKNFSETAYYCLLELGSQRPDMIQVVKKLERALDCQQKLESPQSVAINRPGAENLKPRQLSDAIHEEVGSKLNEQISDVLWEIIRSPDGMKSEITETVKSVCHKLSRTKRDDDVESSGGDQKRTRKEYDYHKSNIASTIEVDDISDNELKEPPGFSQTNELQPPIPLHTLPTAEQQKETVHQSQEEVLQNDPSGAEHKVQGDDSDDDLDAPPGFG